MFDDRRLFGAAEALGPRVRVSDVERGWASGEPDLANGAAPDCGLPGDRFSLGDRSHWWRRRMPGTASPSCAGWCPSSSRAGGHRITTPVGPDGAIPVTMPEISSSDIRAALAAGRPMTDWVSRRVLDADRRTPAEWKRALNWVRRQIPIETPSVSAVVLFDTEHFSACCSGLFGPPTGDFDVSAPRFQQDQSRHRHSIFET